MILWLAIALMTAAALALVLTPLILRRRRAPPRLEFDLTIYRDQLEELERDRERGLIGKDQDAAARLEIQRRMLVSAKYGDGETPPPELADGVETMPGQGPRRWVLIGSMGAVIPAVAIVLYLVLGSPDLPGQPFSQVARNDGGMAGEDMAGRKVEAAIANLASRLEQEPDNREGWFLLGRSLVALERFDEAVPALRTAATLSNGDPDVLGSLAEALVFAAEGVVTPESQAAFKSVLAARPDDAAAQYYLGMALAQQGRSGQALEMWRKLAAQTPADAPWRQDLVTLMRRAAENSDVELGEIPVAPARAAAVGPSEEDMAAAADMDPAARMELIRSMVARLAARLEEEPDDAEGWRRLANAYRVLGEDAKADAAEQRLARLGGGAAQPGEAPPRGPSAEDMAAAGDMSAEERTQMIGVMVAQLAERLRQKPDDPRGWVRLGRSYSVLNRHEEARDAFARAAELAPRDVAVLGDYARAVMNAAGDSTQFPEQAIALYRRIVELDPERREALWFLGFAEAAAGRVDGARDYWNRLLELLPAGGADRKAVEEALDALRN